MAKIPPVRTLHGIAATVEDFTPDIRADHFFDCNNEKNIETIKIGQKKPKILQKITWPGGGGFYPRDALHSAVFAVVRRLSVCLSACHRVTLVDCIRMAEHIVKLLVRPGSPSL